MKDYIVNTPNQLGEVLKGRRKSLRFSQTAIGARVDLNQKTISSIENTPARSEIETLFRLMSALRLELLIRPMPDKIREEVDAW